MGGRDLLFERRPRGRLENNFKRPRLQVGRRRQDAGKAFGDNPVTRRKSVDQGAAIARQDLLGCPQRRFQQLLVEQPAMRVSVETLARVVGVQRDNAVERLCAQLLLEDLHFGMIRTPPEFPIEINSTAIVPRVILIAGRIAHRVKHEIVAGRQCGLRRQRLQSLSEMPPGWPAHRHVHRAQTTRSASGARFDCRAANIVKTRNRVPPIIQLKRSGHGADDAAKTFRQRSGTANRAAGACAGKSWVGGLSMTMGVPR